MIVNTESQASMIFCLLVSLVFEHLGNVNLLTINDRSLSFYWKNLVQNLYGNYLGILFKRYQY